MHRSSFPPTCIMKRVAFFIRYFFPLFCGYTTAYAHYTSRHCGGKQTTAVASEMLSRESESSLYKNLSRPPGSSFLPFFLIPYIFAYRWFVHCSADEATSFVPFLLHCSPITRRVSFLSPVVVHVYRTIGSLLYSLCSGSLSLFAILRSRFFFLSLFLFCRDGHFLFCLFEDIDVVGIASNKKKEKKRTPV